MLWESLGSRGGEHNTTTWVVEREKSPTDDVVPPKGQTGLYASVHLVSALGRFRMASSGTRATAPVERTHRGLARGCRLVTHGNAAVPFGMLM